MHSRKAAVAAAVAVIALASLVGLAAEPTTAKLKSGDVLELAKRFATFNDALPDAAKLGMSRLTAFEEHPHFVYAAGVLETSAGKPAGVRRVIFVKPATFIIDDQFPAGAAARWILEAPTAPDITGRVATVGKGEAHIVCSVLKLIDGAIKLIGQVRGDARPNRQAVEITGRTRFIVALHIGAGATRCTLTEENGPTQVKVASGDRVCDLALPAGADAGTIAVAEGKKPVLAVRPLPAGIMPHGAKGVRMIDGWDRRYRGKGRAPWDSGKPDGKLMAAVEAGTLKPGRAVVLGCGSGTNAIYLASKGFDVTALDVAPTALTIAGTKADKAKVTVRWLVADVLAPPEMKPFDVIFDRGCYHGVRRVSATGYVKTADTLSRPGTMMLILAGNANETRHYGPPRVDETHLVGDFAKTWDFVHLQEHRGGAWFWSALMRRRAK